MVRSHLRRQLGLTTPRTRGGGPLGGPLLGGTGASAAFILGEGAGEEAAR